MSSNNPPFSRRRMKWVGKMFRAWRAERRGDFARAIQLMDEASEITPLGPTDRVQRAMLLLRLQRTREAYQSFDKLRQELKGSAEPDEQYLRHYCTAMLSIIQPGSGQWAYEAKQAKAIKTSWGLKERFPLVTVDEIHDRIKPRR